MRDEVEQAGAGQEHGPDVGTHAAPERWRVVVVFDADAVPTPLRFDTLTQALAHLAQTPGCRRRGEQADKVSEGTLGTTIAPRSRRTRAPAASPRRPPWR